MRNALFLLLYGLAGGVLMSLFMMSAGVTRYLFSLGAVLLGMQFFKRYDSKGLRIGFIVLVLVFSLFFPLIYVMLALANGWYVNPDYLKGVQLPQPQP